MIFGAAAAIVLLGAGVKRMQLRGGGKAVAESLGGRWLNPAGASPSERRLLDVVEEFTPTSAKPATAFGQLRLIQFTDAALLSPK